MARAAGPGAEAGDVVLVDVHADVQLVDVPSTTSAWPGGAPTNSPGRTFTCSTSPSTGARTVSRSSSVCVCSTWASACATAPAATALSGSHAPALSSARSASACASCSRATLAACLRRTSSSSADGPLLTQPPAARRAGRPGRPGWPWPRAPWPRSAAAPPAAASARSCAELRLGRRQVRLAAPSARPAAAGRPGGTAASPAFDLLADLDVHLGDDAGQVRADGDVLRLRPRRGRRRRPCCANGDRGRRRPAAAASAAVCCARTTWHDREGQQRRPRAAGARTCGTWDTSLHIALDAGRSTVARTPAASSTCSMPAVAHRTRCGRRSGTRGCRASRRSPPGPAAPPRVRISSITVWPEWASRAAVGSSQTSSRGSWTSARAMATRCCWPPDSCAGRRVGLVARPSCVQHLRGPRRPPCAAASRRSAAARRRSRRRSAPAAGCTAGRRSRCSSPRKSTLPPAATAASGSSPSTVDLARGRVEQAGDDRDQRRLAAAATGRPAASSRRRQVQVDAAQGRTLRVAAAELLGHAAAATAAMPIVGRAAAVQEHVSPRWLESAHDAIAVLIMH